jgi:transposase
MGAGRKGDPTVPTPSKYPPELGERAVGLVLSSGRPIAQIAEELGINRETLRTWVRQAQADRGQRADLLSTDERQELKRLRKELAELRRANEGVRDAPRGAAAVDAAGSLACRSRSQPRAPRSGRFGESSVRVLSCAGQVAALKAAIPTVAAVRPRATSQPAEVQFGSAAGAGSRGAAPRCRAGSGWS